MAAVAFTAALGNGTVLGLTAATSQLLVAAAGIAIDSFLLYPELFPVPDQKGQRLSDLKIQDTRGGSPSNRPYGSTVRIAGYLAWMTDLAEIENPQSGGGKGGSGGDFIQYQYLADVVIRIAKTPIPLSRVLAVFADGKEFWKAEPDVNVSSNKIAAENQGSVIQVVTNKLLFEEVEFVSYEAEGGPELDKIKSGKTVTVSGFTTTFPPPLLTGNLQVAANAAIAATSISVKAFAVGKLNKGDTIVIQNDTGVYTVQANYSFNGALGTPDTQTITISPGLVTSIVTNEVITPSSGATTNNGEWEVSASGKDQGAQTSFVRVKRAPIFPATTVAPFVNKERGTDTITLFQELPTHSTKQVQDVRFYDGAQEQLADQVVRDAEEQRFGIGEVIAWRNRHTMVLDALNVTDFVNRVPNFEFLCEVTAEDVPLSDAVRDILLDHHIGISELDTSALSNLMLRGFNRRGPQVGKTVLQPIMVAKQLLAFENRGVLTFIEQKNTPTVTVSKLDLGASSGSFRGPHKMRMSDPPAAAAVNVVEVKYRDPAKSYQTDMQESRRPQPIESGDVESIDLDVVLSADEAKQLADTLFAQASESRRSATLTLPPSYLGTVRPGVRILLDDVFGTNWDLLVTRVERGLNMVLNVEVREFDVEVFDQTATAGTTLNPGSSTGDGPNAEAPPVELVPLDLPNIHDETRNVPGNYFAAFSSDPGRSWRGAVLYRSTDGGETYQKETTILDQAVVGRLRVPPSSSASAGTIETLSSMEIEVRAKAFELASITDDQLLRGLGTWAVGGEILSAGVVTLVAVDAARGTKTYAFSRLLRGLRDTDDAIAGHVVGETCVWLNGPGIVFYPRNLATIDQDETWKAVSNGGSVSRATPIQFTPTGRSLRPFRVTSVAGSRDGSNNLTVTWEYQTRTLTDPLVHGVPLEEDFEKYRVEIMSGATVLRTATVTDARSYAYSAANQTTDGLTPGDPVTVRITQLSARVLEGRSRTVTV